MTQLQSARHGFITPAMSRVAMHESAATEFIRGGRGSRADRREPVMIALPVSMAELSALCRRHHVRELCVFGSTARGDARPDSDIDLLVEFEPSARIGFIALARLAHELEALLERKVDLVPKDGLKPRIRDQILREAEVLFAA